MKWTTWRGGKEYVHDVFCNGDELAWMFTKSNFRGRLCGKLEKALKKDPCLESVDHYSLDKIGGDIYISAKDARRKLIWNSSLDFIEYEIHDSIVKAKEQAKADRMRSKQVTDMQKEAMFRNDASVPEKIVHKIKGIFKKPQ